MKFIILLLCVIFLALSEAAPQKVWPTQGGNGRNKYIFEDPKGNQLPNILDGYVSFANEL